MTTYDPLSSGVDVLTAAAIQTLTDAGYPWNPKTTSFSSYLATALTGIGGSSVSDKTMSIPQLLAGLVNAQGAGPVTYLNTGVDQLLAHLGGASGPPLTGQILGNFAAMANGTPTNSTTGQPFVRLVQGDATTVQATVSSGALVAGSSGSALGSAAYTGWQLPEDVTSLYADVSFGDVDDIAALIAAAGLAGIGASSLHIIFGADHWALQYWSSAAITTVQSGSFTSVPFGKKVRIGWRLDGNDVYIYPADGSIVGPITSAAAASRTNHTAIFEHFRGTTGTPGLKFYAVAANLFSDPVAAGRTNVLVAQNNLANAAWTLNSVSGPVSAPPGEQVMETATTDFHWVFQSVPGKAASPIRMTLRFKVKPIGRDWIKMEALDGLGTGLAQNFLDVTTGTLGTQSGTFTDQFWMIYPLPNSGGFCQVQADFLTTAAAGIYGAIGLATGDTVDTYLGDITKGMIVYDEWLYQRPT